MFSVYKLIDLVEAGGLCWVWKGEKVVKTRWGQVFEEFECQAKKCNSNPTDNGEAQEVFQQRY